MVDISGHIGFGLLFSLPAWYLWNDRASVAFLALAVVGALLPDVDLWLAALFPAAVHHHGVTHTVLFVTVASLIGGAVLTGLLGGRIDEWIGSERFDARRLFGVTTAGLLTGSLSHLVADTLSAPDISTPLEPFWPFFEKPWSIDVVWYDAAWINFGLLSVVVVAHFGVAYLTTPAEDRHRLRPI